jgi:protein-S-isoprenylcysteine O-methyltransferase Ste14
LVKSGPYQFTRNPMYVGMLLVLFGWFLFLHNLCGFVFVVLYLVILTELQIKPEERLLEQLFGQQYQDYKKSVPRWIC